MKCPQCKNEIVEEAAFCRFCGSALKKICPNCGAEVNLETGFCKKCDTALYTFPKFKIGQPQISIVIGGALATVGCFLPTAVDPSTGGTTSLMQLMHLLFLMPGAGLGLALLLFCLFATGLANATIIFFKKNNLSSIFLSVIGIALWVWLARRISIGIGMILVILGHGISLVAALSSKFSKAK